MCYEMFICEIHRMEIQVIYTEELFKQSRKAFECHRDIFMRYSIRCNDKINEMKQYFSQKF